MKKKEYKNRKIIGVDPGKQSMVYMLEDKEKVKKKLTYTTAQRRVESMSKRNNFVIKQKRKEKIINDKSVEQHESLLSQYSAKSYNFDIFYDLIKNKMEIKKITDEFYQDNVFRKLKWRKYIHTKRNEDNFLNKIEITYGSPDKLILCYGNWSQTKQMKHLYQSLLHLSQLTY